MSIIGKKLNNKIVLRSPRVTEKSTVLADRGIPVYVFLVERTSTKAEIRQAFKAKYNFSPTKVNIINLPDKVTKKRGRVGIKSGVRKAMIYLKVGQKIEIV